MWESLVRFPRGQLSLRSFVLFFAAVIGLSLAYLFAAPNSVSAADATWDVENIVYEDDTYSPGGLPVQLVDRTDLDDYQTYQFVTDDSDNAQQTVEVIYFPDDVDVREAENATYVRYQVRPPNSAEQVGDEREITITPDPNGDQLEGANRDDDASCTVDGIGWIVCPLMNGIAEGMDFIYERIQGYLVVQPITTSVDNPIYRIWIVSRDLANIAFIIGFIVIIYTYLVGGGFNGYEIRKILPRIVVAAVLINVSYIICAAAVDVSNIAGYGINQLFEAVREDVLTGSRAADTTNWTNVTAYVLAGGVGAGVGSLGLIAATGGSIAGLWFLLAPFLVGAALLVIVTFLILAARQAIIVIFIAIAPLAFACFILPNTEKWFEKWRSVFFTMLVMFPAFGAVFGGAQLAGELIIRTSDSIEQVILGLGVMVAPLAITPLLLRLGGGVLNRFAGIVNNTEKGIFDRFKNYNNDRRQEFLARQNMNNAKRDVNGNLLLGRGQLLRRSAYRQNYKKYSRNKEREANEAGASALYDANDRGIETVGSMFGRRYAQARGRTTNPSYKYGAADIADTEHRTKLLQGYTHGRHDEHWQHELQHDSNLRGMLTNTRLAEGRAKVMTDAMQAQDNRTFATALNTTPAYSGLRTMQAQSVTDAGVADLHTKAVDAAGQKQFRQEVAQSKALTRVVKDTYHDTKLAELDEQFVQKSAEKTWLDRQRGDKATNTLYLRTTERQDGAAIAEKKLEEFTQEVRSRGADARGLDTANRAVAQKLQDTAVQMTVRDSSIETLKEEQNSFVLNRLTSDKGLRTDAGAGTQLGATKVLAKSQSAVTKLHLDNVKAQHSVYSNEGYRVDETLKAMQDPNYRLHDGTPVNVVAQQAAVQYTMEEIGNNWAVQKVIEWADTQGMQLIEGKDGKPDEYYDAQTYRQAKRNGTEASLTPLSSDEVSERRDLLQMVVGGYKGGKNKVSFMTNTLQEKFNRGLSIAQYSEALGRDMSFSETSILSEARQQKYDPNRITAMDPDELSRMVQVLRDPNYRKQLSDTQRTAIVNSIQAAQSSSQTRHLIKDRERGIMNVVAAYLELPADRNPSTERLQEIETTYYEQKRTDSNGMDYFVRVPEGTEGAIKRQVPVETPNEYSYKRQSDYDSGAAMKPPEPR